MYSTPDANTGLNRYLDSTLGEEAERRANMLEAAKEVDIQDRADQILADKSKASALIDWLLDVADPAALLAEANDKPNGLLGMYYKLAALEMAKHEWNVRYGA